MTPGQIYGVCGILAAVYLLAKAARWGFDRYDSRAACDEFLERTNRAAVESRMPYRATTLTIAENDPRRAAEALIEQTKTRPVA